MIEFEKITPEHRDLLLPYLTKAAHRGCGYSFANVVLWGRRGFAFVDGKLCFFTHYMGRDTYSFPIGEGSLQNALDAIIHDAFLRGTVCRLSGVLEQDRETLEAHYPGAFYFHDGRDFYDYVYDIDDLADLRGRKYQQKRNHVNKFLQNYPDYQVQPLTAETLPAARNMVDNWYYRRAMENPDEDIQEEKIAIDRAFRYYEKLGLEGLILFAGNQAAAITMGSFLDSETIDVHFEKAYGDIPGAYPMINREFARYIREKYPSVRYLNREEDMGSPGLRQAKTSYNPHHMVQRCWATLAREDVHA